ncbi:MAG: glycine--tRNA ligase [Spiroplasma poulsonii]|uniref:Glycine--tRNA ligase n=1 Tax=Spiroplasma poulsonii TaxID=2138 RepID=A0A2P6FFC7_9MOLU|nr:glycine--tRNA ligase [Spiroplasma poulsonii]KAF0850188.1 Glycine--tRNA ligase [Spiroplasma poulsonii]MBW1242508.1 glycine--tRNA ligase [Spiroplasma poulsonii]PQM32158.1 Glycine--tRNA ligase [Spiroplasma poulsonii]PWF94802.1 Glycine--tRNA ligase [Spiroplasma poulsonii]PWF97601.1 Glycine--tRNA ligase [Spiroplasma poulsonii]
MQYTLEEVVNHLKAQGFVFQGSEIYGGLANSWDFGPLGVELERNLKSLWWQHFITKSKYNVGLDSAILMNNNVWKASGHLGNFADPLLDCRKCKTRMRADKLIEDNYPDLNCGGWSNEQLKTFIEEKNLVCPNCGAYDFTDIRQFELMFKTNQGVLEDEKSIVYLRPETAQGIFVNFKNVQRSLRKKLPFGIGQIGKSFRNEITPGNFIFRTREFEQMELEFFYDPNEETDWFEYWVKEVTKFLNLINLNPKNYLFCNHEANELAHYAKHTIDVEYKFPFGTGELWGIADRGDFDLRQHSITSKQDLSYLNQETNEKILPHVIEPSVGVGRLMLAILYDAYYVEQVGDNDSRIVLKLSPLLAPYQLAVIPLSKQLNEVAYQLYEKLLNQFQCTYDETGNIGKRYRRQDAIGTPFCVTFDFESLEDQKVTVRNRDTMVQERIAIANLEEHFQALLK